MSTWWCEKGKAKLRNSHMFVFKKRRKKRRRMKGQEEREKQPHQGKDERG